MAQPTLSQQALWVVPFLLQKSKKGTPVRARLSIALSEVASSSTSLDPTSHSPSLRLPLWVPPTPSFYPCKVSSAESCPAFAPPRPACSSTVPPVPSSLSSFLNLANHFNIVDPSIQHFLHSSILSITPHLDASSFLQALAAPQPLPIPSPHGLGTAPGPSPSLSASSSAMSITIHTVPSNPVKLAGHQLADPKTVIDIIK
ncbi:hypothetical protein PAXRUDRAFT_20207 [Paxillus rubicundulus Ve08.2h10]|uniref:Unplaced genomic scaffold scaffold_4339, whole genome shotgun sequence n=1 Tax=Paxillus rubicundulus Ve08.2h10 TaxID=930991 RepID=A0A0D0CSZ0_9AGAM|nr:hypothetical protein PAXRUDRAFT_20207 [Paxillus rubicundulus Ve08.2h10]